MRAVLFGEDESRRLEGEILVVVWGTEMQPIEAVVRLDNGGGDLRFFFNYTRSDQRFYSFEEIVYIDEQLKAWTIFDQNPWDERHHVYTVPSLPLQAEGGQPLDIHRAALMGWVIIDEDGLELQGNPFTDAFGGSTRTCYTCNDTLFEGNFCEHTDTRENAKQSTYFSQGGDHISVANNPLYDPHLVGEVAAGPDEEDEPQLPALYTTPEKMAAGLKALEDHPITYQDPNAYGLSRLLRDM